jgi:hypothetical protein
LTTQPEAAAKPKTIDDYPIPPEWQDETIAPRVKLGKDRNKKPHEWAIAPMSGRVIAKFTAHTIGMKDIIGNLLSGERDPVTGQMRPAEPEKIEQNIEKLYRGVHFGLQRAYPELEFDAFYDLPILPDELLEAFMSIAEAAGVKFERVSITGEAPAAPTES